MHLQQTLRGRCASTRAAASQCPHLPHPPQCLPGSGASGPGGRQRLPARWPGSLLAQPAAAAAAASSLQGGTTVIITARWHHSDHHCKVAPQPSSLQGGTTVIITARWHHSHHHCKVAPQEQQRCPLSDARRAVEWYARLLKVVLIACGVWQWQYVCMSPGDASETACGEAASAHCSMCIRRGSARQ
jgi:hypothetical protein